MFWCRLLYKSSIYYENDLCIECNCLWVIIYFVRIYTYVFGTCLLHRF